MDLDFSGQQEALRGMAREVCLDHATIEVARSMEDHPEGIPETHGGSQQGLLEAPIRLFFRRAKQLQISWWDSRHLEELIARQTLD